MSTARTPHDDRRTLVLIPGIQGRCEWMQPAIAALSSRQNVLTFSLNTIGTDRFFERCADHIDALLRRAGTASAAILGVSFGGLIAVHYAASRGSRAAQLILSSSPSPNWSLDPVSRRYTRTPRLALPAFALRAVPRLAPEIAASLPAWMARVRFTAGYLARIARYPVAPRLMAAWVDAWMAADVSADCRHVSAPTLVLTGEAGLDRVVPVTSTLDYLELIPHARHVTLSRTGHIGLLTRPDAYAAIVEQFLDECAAPRVHDSEGP